MRSLRDKKTSTNALNVEYASNGNKASNAKSAIIVFATRAAMIPKALGNQFENYKAVGDTPSPMRNARKSSRQFKTYYVYTAINMVPMRE